jgi:hypothetical protein
MGHGTLDMASFAVGVRAGLTEIGPAARNHARRLGEAQVGRPPARLDGGLRLPLSVEHGGIQRRARRLARPHHELEGREIPLAGIERGGEQRLALAA